MITRNPEVVAKHTAKGVRTGSWRRLRRWRFLTLIRVWIDGNAVLALLGHLRPGTGKFLHKGGSHFDLPLSVRPGNILSLMRVGMHNLDLVKYLVEQGLQSQGIATCANCVIFIRMPWPRDWEVIDAGIRVQAIKQEPGEEPGIVHYGTEVLTSDDKTISALLGASPGASVSTQVMLECIQRCLPQLLESDEAKERMSDMIPNWNHDLKVDSARNRYLEIHEKAMTDLNLI